MLQGRRTARLGACATLTCVVTAVWVLTFALSRAHMMFEAYSDFAEAREDESWLLGQCSGSEFYSRMKQHSSLCDEVTHKAKTVILLQAVRHVIDNSYLCGYDPCADLLDRLAGWALGRGLVLSMLCLALLVFGPVCLVPFYRRQMNMMADQRVKELYYTPFEQEQFLIHSAHSAHGNRFQHDDRLIL